MTALRRRTAGLLTFVSLAVALVAQEAKTSLVQLPKGQVSRTILACDVDGDDRDDLAIAVSSESKSFERSVRIHRRKDGPVAFGNEPDHLLSAPPDAVSFAIADVLVPPGVEIVWFTPFAVYAQSLTKADERPTLLAEGDYLFQPPSANYLYDEQRFVKDLDGDGFADLVIPGPDGYALAIQRRDGAKVSFETTLIPARHDDRSLEERSKTMFSRRSTAQGAARVRIRMGGEGTERDPLVEATESLPVPVFADFDGDGDLDLLVQSVSKLRVHAQTEKGLFAVEPSATFPLPVVADRRRLLDVSYSAQVKDLDGDGRSDCVIFAGDQNAKDVRTQILVYVQGKGDDGRTTRESPLFGPEGLPRQLIVVGGFAGSPALRDVDGDGLPDLTLGALRVDTIDVLAARKSQELDAEVYVYRNLGSSFSPEPDLRHTVRIRVDDFRSARNDLTARFIGDLTGDGVSEMLVRDAPDHIGLFMVRYRRGEWSVPKEPLWQTKIDKSSDVVVTRSGSPSGQEILVVESSQIMHVRFE